MTLTPTRVFVTLATAVVLMLPAAASAQDVNMSFFVAPEGPSWGSDRPALEVSDQHCADLAYAQGYGHLTWHAYLNGSPADGEGDQLARDRIGTGPWYNFHGVLIAESVEQLHTDDNNLWEETAVTVTGEYPPEGAVKIVWGSELDGSLYDRAGPYFCFGF
jgi:hypothetical protein